MTEKKDAAAVKTVVYFEDLDPDFKNQIMNTPGGEKILTCYQCGTCTAGCPVSAVYEEYNPRKIIKMALMGMKREALSSKALWQCTQCHICVAHCPQDTKCADIIRTLRQIAVREGFFPESLAVEVEKLDEELKKLRIEKIGELVGRLP